VLKYYLEDLEELFQYFCRIYICAIFKVFCLWPTRLDRVHIPIRADRLILLQIELRNPQHGQLSVITAHFKPAEISTCFKTIKQFLLYYHVSYSKL
jgi:hypothetical protein